MEVNNKKQIVDIGAVRHDGATFHENDLQHLLNFIENINFLGGHNIVHYDATYLFQDQPCNKILVDTLCLSPLLFPNTPYHRLVKDYKLDSDEANNPLKDSELALNLLDDEITEWNKLPKEMQTIFASLLHDTPEFKGFLQFVGAGNLIRNDLPELISDIFSGKICAHADLNALIAQHPQGLAYALAVISATEKPSITPSWVLHQFPETEIVMKRLRHTNCGKNCNYCNEQFDLKKQLKLHFGYDNFRTFNGEPLQERAVQAAVNGQSLLVIFPTGGGKSLTFQLPAFIAKETMHGLTVVISPLLSLMKDQIDNLIAKDKTDAVYINSLLDPLERAVAIESVQNGKAALLYIAPEMLRSKTIERILLGRNVVRFVIDEAHCFSAWGHDFRVDYLYIGKFIAKYQKLKGSQQPPAVSCFTATAKPNVIKDIANYFEKYLKLELKLFTSTMARTNLTYQVIKVGSEEEKYPQLRALVKKFDCPTIVYVARTKMTRELTEKFKKDKISALPFNGKMANEEKKENQEAFMNDNVRVIVATSAFGMGVDKANVGLVVHYDISDSLENYVQEAGRAGRDQDLNANCFILFNEEDLDKHLLLLNQTKLNQNEVAQIWKSVKYFTAKSAVADCSAIEIARQAGWDNTTQDTETRVRTAIATLEEQGYMERKNNAPKIFATGIRVKNMDEARARLKASPQFKTEEEVENAARIIKSLMTKKQIARAQDDDAEARVDYLADILGLKRQTIVSLVNKMKVEGILEDCRDISANLLHNSIEQSKNRFEDCAKIEFELLQKIGETDAIPIRQLYQNFSANEKEIRTLLYFLEVKDYLLQKFDDERKSITVRLNMDAETTKKRLQKRADICRFIIEKLHKIASNVQKTSISETNFNFSIVDLFDDIQKTLNETFFNHDNDVHVTEVEEALLYLSKIDVLKLNSGFLVLYNAMTIERKKEKNEKFSKQADYKTLDHFYKMKVQQIHIVGEYAKLMSEDVAAAQRFVNDYFQLEYGVFIEKYFPSKAAQATLGRNITQKRYDKLFKPLSPRQMEIINGKAACIVVGAGPGSGKTRVLAHKLAALLLMEEVKHDQLLMLTFSRAAATEFKSKLKDLIGNDAHFVEIKTFHSFCYNLLGRPELAELAEENENKKKRDIVLEAATMIETGEIEPSKITKTALVIDEAQDMSTSEYALVQALMHKNDDMRVIAVGDDDQNIYGFRNSDAALMQKLREENNGTFIEMTDNYRSSRRVVAFANNFVEILPNRQKTTPIQAVRADNGCVEVTRHISDNLYAPLVEQLRQQQGKGTTCLLTKTNEEALIVASLLRKNGVKCQLLQSQGESKPPRFMFCNLMEVRFFMKCFKKLQTPIIPDEKWDAAKLATYAKYGNSANFSYIKNGIETFEQSNGVRYLSDLQDFVYDSNLEEFFKTSEGEVVVSTIHKAKGREFDDVFMLVANSKLSQEQEKSDEALRVIYVGITRAKNRLFIHTNTNLFANLPTANHHCDKQMYEKPCDIILQTGLRDMDLSFYNNHHDDDIKLKGEICTLRSGDALSYGNFRLMNPNTGSVVVKFSKKMREKLAKKEQEGYRVVAVSVDHIVAWKDQEAPSSEPTWAVVLPEMTLSSSC